MADQKLYAATLNPYTLEDYMKESVSEISGEHILNRNSTWFDKLSRFERQKYFSVYDFQAYPRWKLALS